MIEYICSNTKSNLVLFVHGLMGGRQTWLDGNSPSKFVQFLLNDSEIKDHCDFVMFLYPTWLSDIHEDLRWWWNIFRRKKKVRKNLKIDDIADLLYSHVRNSFKSYERIMIIAHSMGGLVSKSCILKTILADDQRIKLYISLAVPHNGANLANLGKLVLDNPHIKDLAPLEEFLNTVNSEWLHQEKLPKTVYHQGKFDRIVSKESAIGYDRRKIEPIYSDNDHFSIIKPENEQDIVVTSTLNYLKSGINASFDDVNFSKDIDEGSEENSKGDNFQNLKDVIIVRGSKIDNSFNRNKSSDK